MFVIACIVIPGFELRAALRERPRLQAEPAALAPEPGTEALLGPVTAIIRCSIKSLQLLCFVYTLPRAILLDT